MYENNLKKIKVEPFENEFFISIDWPDLQLQFVAGSVISDSGVKLRYNDGLKDSV